MQLDSVKLDDPRELLPHFTVQLWCELERRLADRAVNERWYEHVPMPDDLFGRVLFCPFGVSRKLAHELVARIYRTQLKEAAFVMSFSTSVLRFNEAAIAAKNAEAKEFTGEKLEKLSTMFGSDKKSLA